MIIKTHNILLSNKIYFAIFSTIHKTVLEEVNNTHNVKQIA